MGKKWTKADYDKLISLKKDKLTWQKISTILHRTLQSCRKKYNILQKKNLAPYAADAYNAEEILSYYKKNGHTKTLERYGIYSIKYLKKKKLWKRTTNKNEKKVDDFLKHKHRWYWAGFIAADGCVLKNTNAVSIGLAKKDSSHLYKLKRILGGGVWDSGDKTDWKITGCNDLRNFLFGLNIVPRKSLILKPPASLKNDKITREFMRGYFDGDGCISSFVENTKRGYKYRRTSVSVLGTMEFLLWGRQQFEKLNICSHNKIGKSRNVYCLSYSKKEDVITILDWLYGDAGIYLDRKYKKYLEVKNLMNC